jgi:hypothetical protein
MMRIESALSQPFSVRRYSLARICKALGKSRQSHYKWRNRVEKSMYQADVIISYVEEQRLQMPEIGGVKLYKALHEEGSPLIEGIGRDTFLVILAAAGLLRRPRKWRVRTTDSRHGWRRYPNVIRGVKAAYPFHILVADITYLYVGTGFCYVSLITDLYSRKIVGYAISDSLAATGNLRALRMAIRHIPPGRTWIHHSDCGSQYCSEKYTKMVTKHGGTISMTETDHAAENAVAERVNGILKMEFHMNRKFRSFHEAAKALKETVRIYNTQRPHMCLQFRTPEDVFTTWKIAA